MKVESKTACWERAHELWEEHLSLLSPPPSEKSCLWGGSASPGILTYFPRITADSWANNLFRIAEFLRNKITHPKKSLSGLQGKFCPVCSAPFTPIFGLLDPYRANAIISGHFSLAAADRVNFSLGLWCLAVRWAVTTFTFLFITATKVGILQCLLWLPLTLWGDANLISSKLMAYGRSHYYC